MAGPTWPPNLDAEVGRHLSSARKCAGMKDKGGHSRCSCGATQVSEGPVPRLCVYDILNQVSSVLNGMELHMNLFALIRDTHGHAIKWAPDSKAYQTKCPFCDYKGESLTVPSVNSSKDPGAFFKCWACGAAGGPTEWMWHLVADRGFRNAWKEAKDGQDASE